MNRFRVNPPPATVAEQDEQMARGFGAALALTAEAERGRTRPMFSEEISQSEALVIDALVQQTQAAQPPQKIRPERAADSGFTGPLYVAEANAEGVKLYLSAGNVWSPDLQVADTYSNKYAAIAFVRAALILRPEMEEFVCYPRVRHGLVLVP